MGVYITTLILLHTDLTSDEQDITKQDAPLFRVMHHFATVTQWFTYWLKDHLHKLNAKFYPKFG